MRCRLRAWCVKRDDLIRRLRRYAGRLGGGELSPLHVKRICRQLGIDPDEL